MKDRKRLAIVLALVAAVAAGCAGRKGTAPAAPAAASRWQRPALQEVSAEQLQLDGRLIDAVALQETGHRDEALAAYASLTHDAPATAAAWYGQAVLLMERGWSDSALHCARRAAELEGGNEWYLLALAHTAAQAGRRQECVATWERLAALRPERPEYCFELSNACLAAGDAAAAVEALNRMERRVGVTETVSLRKQQIWDAAGKPDKGLREMEALADALPQEKRYQALLAQHHMQQKNYRKAKPYYDRILAADPDDEYIHLQLAEYYKAVGQPAAADSEMVRALAHPRLDTRTKLQLLTSFYSEEEFYGSHREVCLRLMEQVARESDTPEATAVYYGDVLMRQGRYAEAATQLELALQHDSSRYEVWEALLISLTEVPEREAALADYAGRAERLFPMHTLPHHLTGLVALRQERYDDAVAALEKAVKWGFTKGYLEAETYGLLAEAHYRSGHYSQAWLAFDHYLALRPDDWGMLNNYAYYLAEQRTDLEKAERMSRRTVEAEPQNANSLDTYAWILHLLGRDAEALPYAQRAVRLAPQSDTLRQHLEAIAR